jgi:hypothetical protein
VADICPFFGVVLSNWGGRFAPTSQLAQNHPKKGANIGHVALQLMPEYS